MTKRLSIALLAVVLIAAMAVPASAGGWEEKVTGGGQAVAGATHFSITVSADSDGESATGQMQYSRSDLEAHATVQCVGVFPEYGDYGAAVAVGPAKVQYDPNGFVGEDEWMVVEILEGGVGAGDRVRVRLMSDTAAALACENPSGSFPGYIYDGNFSIRTKD